MKDRVFLPAQRDPPLEFLGRRAIAEAAGISLLLAPLLMVVARYDRTWFFFDEWSLIGRIVRSHDHVRSLFELYNGHLYAAPYLVYLGQLELFGIGNHAFVYGFFCLTLLAWSAALALTLRAAFVPPLLAAASAILIVYFGPGSQLSTFEINLATDGAFALTFSAAALALHARPGAGSAACISGLLCLALVFDSGAAVVGVIFVGILVAARFRRVCAFLAIGAPAVASIAVAAFARDAGDIGTSTIAKSLSFGKSLFLLTLGGLAGGGERAGFVVIAFVFVVLLPIALRLQVSGVWPITIAGAVAALAMAALLAQTRAGLVRHGLADYNRYLTEVGVFCVVAIVPLLWAIIRRIAAGRDEGAAAGLTLVVVLVFALNLDTYKDARAVFEQWNQQTRVLVSQALSPVRYGCPAGRSIDRLARPLGLLDPTVDNDLLIRLQQQGYVDFAPSPPTRALLAVSCPSPGRVLLTRAQLRIFDRVDRVARRFCERREGPLPESLARDTQKLIGLYRREPTAISPGPYKPGQDVRQLLADLGGLFYSRGCAIGLGSRIAAALQSR